MWTCATSRCCSVFSSPATGDKRPKVQARKSAAWGRGPSISARRDRWGRGSGCENRCERRRLRHGFTGGTRELVSIPVPHVRPTRPKGPTHSIIEPPPIAARWMGHPAFPARRADKALVRGLARPPGGSEEGEVLDQGLKSPATMVRPPGDGGGGAGVVSPSLRGFALQR